MVANYRLPTDSAGRFDLELAGNVIKVDLTEVPTGAGKRPSYGSVTQPAPTPAHYAETGRHVIGDLAARAPLFEQGRLAVGANNLFDVYPAFAPETNAVNYNNGGTAKALVRRTRANAKSGHDHRGSRA